MGEQRRIRENQKYATDPVYREKKKLQSKEYAATHDRTAYIKQWKEIRDYDAMWRKLHPTYAKQKYEDTKREVLGHYSPDIRCAICGKSDFNTMSIDHIDGGGSAHRKELGSKGGYGFYLWLKRNNYPTGYRVLCMDCNRRN